MKYVYPSGKFCNRFTPPGHHIPFRKRGRTFSIDKKALLSGLFPLNASKKKKNNCSVTPFGVIVSKNLSITLFAAFACL